MSSRVRCAVRAVAEAAVELIASWNRKRLPQTESPYVIGVHAPMHSELTLKDLLITGALPVGLDGRYLKMGANPVNADPREHDWFLGDGMVHGIALRSGRVEWYRNRWIRSRSAAAALGRDAPPRAS